MSQRFGAAFGAALALILLLLFAGATLDWIYEILQKDGAEVTKTSGYIYVLTTVSGLVSALVIAQLSVTKPGAVPTLAGMRPESAGGALTVNIVVAIYLLVWMLTGLAALVVGVMLSPVDAQGVATNRTIADLGTTWLGLAVSAAYAYFGISPGTDKGGAQDEKAAGARLRALLANPSSIETQLGKRIADGRITFDKDELKQQLLRNNAGTQITQKLQALVLELCDLSPAPIVVSDLPRTGRAVDIGNEAIASTLLPLVATDAQVKALDIDEIIFDAAVAGESDRNRWNYDGGEKHGYDPATLDGYKDRIRFSVGA